jgi:hypothetical protein
VNRVRILVRKPATVSSDNFFACPWAVSHCERPKERPGEAESRKRNERDAPPVTNSKPSCYGIRELFTILLPATAKAPSPKPKMTHSKSNETNPAPLRSSRKRRPQSHRSRENAFGPDDIGSIAALEREKRISSVAVRKVAAPRRF